MPTNPDLYKSRAQIRVLLNNDGAGALTDLDSAIKLDPKCGDLHVEHAWVNSKQKNNTAAIADLDNAIALKQGDPSLYLQRGEIYYRTHNYAKAMTDWKKSLELKHDDSATYNAMAWLFAASPDPKVRDGKKAIEFCDQGMGAERMEECRGHRHARRGVCGSGRLQTCGRVREQSHLTRWKTEHRGGLPRGLAGFVKMLKAVGILQMIRSGNEASVRLRCHDDTGYF